MLIPTVYGENLFDDFDDMFGLMPFETQNKRDPLFGKNASRIMKTDIRETETGYELDIDLPGFKKEEVQVQLENGYLTISASKGLDRENEEKKGRYIQQERYMGQCSRSFYVGGSVRPEDVSAKFEDGILRVTLPKNTPKQLEAKNTIAIE